MSVPAISRAVKPLAPNSSLRFLNIKGLTGFEFRFSNHHAYAASATRHIGTEYHPIHEMIQQRWEARTDPLWWSCIARKEVGWNKRVVRSWMSRRLRQSFVEALKENGYAKDGTTLGTTANKSDLVGTVQLCPLLGMLKMKPDELLKQTDMVVKAIIKKQGSKDLSSTYKKAGQPGILSRSLKGKVPAFRRIER